eukprot:m.355205 g.355205  ORF g.355205 m.355205 type:complete len:67 (+) comp55942_c0_seq7:632-832(+)
MALECTLALGHHFSTWISLVFLGAGILGVRTTFSSMLSSCIHFSASSRSLLVQCQDHTQETCVLNE